ncbi:MAG: deoxyguanosinetriphosphate triphosphohydrolase [Alphaproteobacteria bacterium]
MHPSLSVFACDPAASRGRRFNEPPSSTRSAFQRDRDRIIHSTAFRRLTYKTQVFVYHEGDHYRTRLTHSLEVSQIARSIARVLGVNEDLAEALALAHDLGHTPFGHAGERALALAMEAFGGFDHNAQALRIVTAIEHRYASFDGLNLSWETLEGLAKHNGPLVGEGMPPELPHAITSYAGHKDLDLGKFAGLEAQIAAISDDIAYDNHDIDDGLRAGLFDLPALGEVAMVGAAMAQVTKDYGTIEPARLIHETSRRLVTAMVDDVIAQTRENLAALNPQSADDIRGAGAPVAEFSPQMRSQISEVKAFLFAHMYRHPRVTATMDKVEPVVGALFGEYLKNPASLPAEWRAGIAEGNDVASNGVANARHIADFIAGMTDRFALSEYQRLFARPVDFG